jgi:hypothetical protein
LHFPQNEAFKVRQKSVQDPMDVESDKALDQKQQQLPYSSSTGTETVLETSKPSKVEEKKSEDFLAGERASINWHEDQARALRDAREHTAKIKLNNHHG